ncbi:MAG TPA: PDZ domain-containing protein [Vicinamibacterales bacterium]|nr:PDZ domain-containing protein [Vicinamibacterales bacterium]HPW21666.1 PDZ domain-containing protein [Vicinamibacterales bacterium]
MKRLALLLACAAAAAIATPTVTLHSQAPAAGESRLLRFPAIHGNRIVFTYAGDLYTVPAAGGTARRLTSDIGFEMFARFSPDGERLAFTGQYDGNTEVYVMPSDGGVPKRVTYTATLGRDDVSDRMGPNNIVIGWKNATQILFRSRRTEWNDFRGQLYLASVDGGPIEEVPLPRGGFGMFSPDGRQFVYNRVFREFRTWKRYRGGQADEVWLHDFAAKTTTNLTNNPAQDIIPMWRGSKVYFASDRGDRGRMNLYSYDLATRQTKALTSFAEFDVKFPSLGDAAIVFENGGWIYRLDLATERVARVPIVIREDFDGGRGAIVDVSRSITTSDIAPDGSRALFGARGDVFTVPAKHGPTRNLTRTPGVHERDARWSPDGRWVAYISDATGEDEIYVAPQDGRGAAAQVTSGNANYMYQPLWSPDSKKLLWANRQQQLHVVDVATKAVTRVAESAAFEIRDYAWSPDSRFVAYAKPEVQGPQRIYLYSLDSRRTIAATDAWFGSSSPAFSPDGKLLFFVSARSFSPTYGQTEFEHIYADMSRIYFVTLAKDTKSPFAPKSDEVKLKDEATPADAKPGEAKPPGAGAADAKAAPPGRDDGAPALKVDEDGLMERIGVVPTPPGTYRSLAPAGNRIYYVRTNAREAPALYVYDLEKQAETQIGAGLGFALSADGKKMLLVQQGQRYAIIDAPTGKAEPREFLDLGDLKVTLDRRAEWRQIFHESWRQMRDFFYAPNMHGVDWPGARRTYEPLLAHVNHRADLTYVIGEMIGELNAGHAYVGGGDLPRLERVPMGLLGARLERDPQSKAFRITRILKGQNWDPALRSPLTDIGVDARVGDYILAVDGRPTAALSDIWEALVGKAGKQVTLSLNARPSMEGARETVVVPVEDERGLYYFNWVQGNLEKVAKATGGRVGYMHIPDMGVPGLNEFAKYFYPQTEKEAMIVDVRSNGGGNVSPMIIERLRRELVMVNIARNGNPQANPGAMILGPKVLLADEFSASDGDLVTYRFKTHRIGPVIGKRTWGGVVGIRGTLPLLDGGVLNRPEFSRYDVAGKSWVIEGVGVEPDIEVDNDPAREYAGEDQQLDKAIEVILDLMRTNPAKLAPPPPLPIKK